MKSIIILMFCAIVILAGCNPDSTVMGPTAVNGKNDQPDNVQPTLPPVPLPVAPEVRGTWLNPYAFRDENAQASILNTIQQMHLNTVFVVAPSIGENYGWADNEPMFTAFIQKAHAAGLKVYAWIGNMHRRQGIDAQFNDPTEQAAQGQWALALMDKYHQWIDGIHCDFIRTNNWHPVNENGMLDGVTATIRSIRDAITSRYPGKTVTSTSFPTGAAFADFTQEDIPQWFRDWFAANPSNDYQRNAPDNAQTVPEHLKFQQNPIGWAKEGIVEGFTPMEYTTDDGLWNTDVAHWKSFMQFTGVSSSKLWMGLGWLTEAGHGDWGYDPAGIVRKIKEGRQQGIGGFVIFELGRFGCTRDQELVDALTKDSPVNGNDAPFKLPTSSGEAVVSSGTPMP